MTPPRVVVTIDEVRLHGFDQRDRSAIGVALERELALRFGAAPLLPLARTTLHADAGAFPLVRGAGAASIGAGIAARVEREVRTPC